MLAPEHDLVLADVWFGRGADGSTKPRDRLDDIIDIVRSRSLEFGLERPIPIIAYTGRGPSALKDCIRRRSHLFDIWDKQTASPIYVTWRLAQLAAELSRIRPDALMQRLIRQMNSNVPWHHRVIDMTKRYNSAWTESDQIERVGATIQDIAHDLRVWNSPCQAMWGVMQKWESVSRATSYKARGHARHVINVFWLGYYLLHHPLLKEWFVEAWKAVIIDRGKLSLVKDDDPLVALSNCWYFAALYHDSAGCVQKHLSVRQFAEEMVDTFKDTIGPTPKIKEWPPKDLSMKADDLFGQLGEEVRKLLQPLWKDSVKHGAPDHGIVAALHIMRSVTDPRQACFAREAARAMAVHNLVGDLKNDMQIFKWESEPLMCLLLLCDQLQTWDRERGDSTLRGPDSPDRAQLSDLIVKQEGDRVTICMSIDYIAPRHLDHATEIFERVKTALEMTLKDKPNRALARIAKPWPFNLQVTCRLSGKPLSHGISY